jgi:hypothetical protein
MTGEDFLKLLHNDTSLLLRTIIANNPNAVAGNISAARLHSPDQRLNDPFTILMNLYSRGKYDQVAKIINVPYLPSTLPAGYDDFFREAVQIRPTPKMMLKADTGNSGSWWQNMDWGGILDSVGGLYSDIVGGNETTLIDNTVQPLPPEAPKDNTILYVGGGIAALLIVVLLFVALKK